MAKVTDPDLIAQLEGLSALKKVTDPALLAQLESDDVSNTTYNKPGIGARALKNLPADIQNIGQSTIDVIVHPIDTVKGLGNMVIGGMQSALPDAASRYYAEDLRPNFQAAIEPYKKDFGSIEGFKEAIAERPATTFLNVTGALSGASNLAKGAVGKSIRDAAQNNLSNIQAANKLTAPKRAILQKGHQAGYVFPPSQAGGGGFINNRLEGIAGKTALGQESVLRNQAVTTALARKGLGLAEDQPIDLAALEAIRRKSGAPYAETATLPNPQSLARGYSAPQQRIASAKILENLKQARNDAQGWYQAYERSASPDDLKKAKAADNMAHSLDAELGNRARAAGRNDLRQQLHEARTEIAKSYTVQKALNFATREIDPAKLGQLYKKGKGRVLTGDLKTIGEMQQAFPDYMKRGEGVKTPGVSKIEAVTSLAGGGVGGLIGGGVGAFFGAALPLMSTPIRNMLLSGPYQRRFAKMAEKNPSNALMLLDKAINKNANKAAIAGLLYNERDSRNNNH